MKKILSILLIFSIILVGCSNGGDLKKEGPDEVKEVYTSMYPVYAMVKYIGGDKVNVSNIMPNNRDAHHWEPKAKDIINLSEADILFINGLGMESWLEKTKESLGDLKIVDLSKDLDLIKIDEEHDNNHEEDDHDHEEHHHHNSEYDPHIWLSLDNLEDELERICDELSKISPENKKYFEDNLSKYENEIEKIEDEYEDKFDKYEGRAIIVPHEAFGYLVKDLELIQISIEGINSDSEPGSGRLKEIIDYAKKNSIKTVFYEKGGSKEAAETIAREINGEVKEISTLEVNLEEDKDFLEIYKDNLDSILDSFE